MIPDRLSATAFARPDAPFLVTDEEVVTFGEADDRSARMAGGILARGVRAGDRVAVWGGVDVETALLLSALLRAGVAAVPLNPRLTSDEARRQATEAGVVAWMGHTEAPHDEVIGFGDLDGPLVAGSERPDREEALVVFTSGTSGPAKGVRLARGALDAAAVASAAFLRHRADDRWLAVLPLCHVGGIQVLVRSAFVGASVHLVPGFDVAVVERAVRRCTLASVVSPMLRRLLDAGADPGALRAVLLGGGPVPPGLAEEAVDAGWPVLPTYGQTETVGQVATCPPATPGRKVARPLSGIEMRIVGDGGGPVGAGEVGVIEVRGPTLFTGYLGEPDRRPDAWHRTGDLGALDAIGDLTVVGRADAVIVTGGENVHPDPVEAALLGAGATDAAVIGLPDPVWGQVVVALVVGADPGALEVAVRGAVPGFAVPRRWVVVDAIPRNEMGKVDRARAERMAGGG